MGGTTLTIQIYSRFVTAEELVRAGSVSPRMLHCIRDAVEHAETF